MNPLKDASPVPGLLMMTGVHLDLLLAGPPLLGRGRHLVPEPGGGHPLVDPPSARIVLHNNTADMDEGWVNLRIFN